MARKNGGYAFPTGESGHDPYDGSPNGSWEISGGITIWDYYAARAMGALIIKYGDLSDTDDKWTCSRAADYADEMLKKREE